MTVIELQAAASNLTSGPSWYWGGSSHPWFLFGFLFWLLPLLVFGLLIFLAARWLYRAGSRENFPRSVNTSSITILEQRYAKGEITKEQFEQMRRDLQQ
jgi:putative membrane protein